MTEVEPPASLSGEPVLAGDPLVELVWAAVTKPIGAP
jgi:hypothetical protein